MEIKDGKNSFDQLKNRITCASLMMEDVENKIIFYENLKKINMDFILSTPI